MLVADALLTAARVILSLTLLFVVTVSKLVPEIVTAVPAGPIEGVKLLIDGTPDVLGPTVKDVLLVADPFGDVTAISPLVAAEGTVTTNSVAVADVMLAAVPLKVTVF